MQMIEAYEAKAVEKPLPSSMFHIPCCLWGHVSSTQNYFRRSRPRRSTYGSLVILKGAESKFGTVCRSAGTIANVDVVLGPFGYKVCPVCFPSPAKTGYFLCQTGGCVSGRIRPLKLRTSSFFGGWGGGGVGVAICSERTNLQSDSRFNLGPLVTWKR